jgi:hypothetical protein
MTQMIRKQIYIERRQQSLLKRLAKRRGVSEAEIIRTALDRELGAGDLGSVRPDPQAFAQAQRHMLARRALVKTPAVPYHFRREDAYEERARRYERKA